RSSDWLTSCRAWVTNGIEASIVGPEDLTPGSASTENLRSDGSAAFRVRRVGVPVRSTASSAGIDCCSGPSSRANAAAVVLKFVTRLFRSSSWRSSARKTLAWPCSTVERSCGSVPSAASLASELLRYADGHCFTASRKPWAPPSASPCEYSLRKSCRFLRVSVWSAVSTWPNCTDTDVWLIGIVPPSFSFGDSGEPGWTSTNSLPSRKTRGRILSCASVWSGSPSFFTDIVTRAAPRPPGRPLTESTVPTFTPAMRTGDFGCRLFTFWKTAENLYGCENGLNRVKPQKLKAPSSTSAITPAL